MKKLIAILLLAAMCVPFMACTNDEEINTLNEEIDVLSEEIDALNEKNNTMSEEINTLNGKIDILEEKLAKQEADNNTSTTENIIGTWVFDDSGYNAGIKITLKEDSTFTYTLGTESVNGKWTYMPEMNAVLMVAMGEGVFGMFEEIDGVLKLNMEGDYAVKEN